jgi:hypothetical protein
MSAIGATPKSPLVSGKTRFDDSVNQASFAATPT